MANISVRLAGGLGNQLFQINKAYNIADRLGQNCKLTFEASYLVNYLQPRKLSVFVENLPQITNTRSLIVHRLRLAKLLNVDNTFMTFINDLNSRSKAIPRGENIFLDGYFQDITASINKKLVSHLRSQLRHRSNPASVIIHIRGTDVIGRINYADLKNYYLFSLSEVLKNSKISNVQVITDDVPFARSLVNDLSCKAMTFSQGSEDEDFTLAVQAEYLICAPSSFSYWAGILSGRPFYFPGYFIDNKEVALKNVHRESQDLYVYYD